jgi:hypothetical protein
VPTAEINTMPAFMQMLTIAEQRPWNDRTTDIGAVIAGNARGAWI